MEHKKPRQRKRKVTDNSKGLARRGEGLGKELGSILGDVLDEAQDNSSKRSGAGDDPFDVSARDEDESFSADPLPGAAFSGHSGGAAARRRGGGLKKLLLLLIILVIAYFFFTKLMSGLGAAAGNYSDTISAGSGVSTGWTDASAANSDGGTVDTAVSDGARDKFTEIKGDGRDVVTIMVYMCGTDLESQSAMGTNDLNEMLKSEVGGNVNLIVYTGGCKRWRNNIISSDVNQIYQIRDGRITRLVDDAGTGSMTDPTTLLSFLNWGKKNFPANRYDLILWDHGTGSLYGYGYDEKYPNRGQMTLEQVDRAVTQSGIEYDFIGFDACLMATAETAIMLGDNADYLIASEEVEPGVGWYYTDWLRALGENTSMATTEIGKTIVDSFVEASAKQARGQSTTLSVIDLAELSQTLPSKMKSFSSATSDMIDSGNFAAVSKARSGSKEFARGEKLDQIDLVHFATNLGTDEGKALADTIRSAVKYNRTSNDVANAYGLSVYFPYRATKYVDVASAIYKAIGVDESYTALISKFGQYQVGGQSTSGGSYSPYDTLFGNTQNSGYQGYGSISQEDAEALLQLLFGGRIGQIKDLNAEGITKSNSDFLRQQLSDEEISSITEQVPSNRLAAEDLRWIAEGDRYLLDISEDKWDLISSADQAVYVDDGKGYIELGLDNIYDWDGNKLAAVTDGTWIAIDGQPMAYYHTETLDVSDDEYSIRGYVPCLLNGRRAKLIIVFDSGNEDGYVAGASYDYENTEAVPKNLLSLRKGDRLQFTATCYNYDGTLDDDYRISDEITVTDASKMEISNVDVKNSGKVKVVYRLTDVFGARFWTDPIELN